MPKTRKQRAIAKLPKAKRTAVRKCKLQNAREKNSTKLMLNDK